MINPLYRTYSYGMLAIAEAGLFWVYTRTDMFEVLNSFGFVKKVPFKPYLFNRKEGN